MIHCNVIANPQNHPKKYLGSPHPDTIVQLGGMDEEKMAKAAKILQEAGWHEINVNVGCPSKPVQVSITLLYERTLSFDV